MDVGAVRGKLREVLDLIEVVQSRQNAEANYYDTQQAQRVQALKPIVARILAAIDPQLPLSVDGEAVDFPAYGIAFGELATRVRQGIALLDERNALEAMLEPEGPTVEADRLHPWVWDAAKGLWTDGHFQDALAAAAQTLEKHVQAKLDSRRRSGRDLFLSAYSDSEPKPDEPRLRPPAEVDADSDTWRSLLDGAKFFGAGCASLVRNIAAHERGSLTEQECYEGLAALSLLARRVDADEVVWAT